MATSTWEGLAALPEADLPGESFEGRLFSGLGGVLDAVLLRVVEVVLNTGLMPRGEDLPAIRAAVEPYIDGQLWHCPQRFFSFVDSPVEPLSVSGKFRRFINGNVVMAREIATGYRPYPFGGVPTDAHSVAPADKVLVEHWMHEAGRARATVLALHGLTSGNPRIDAFLLFAAQCFDRGFDVALLTLPFHGARTPPEARFSGERFAGRHVAGVNEAIRQAAYEIHVVSGWLRQCTGAPVGLLGMSLGGYLAALMAGLSNEWEFIIPMVPPVCMGDLAWRFFTRSREFKRGRTPAFSQQELRAIYRVHSPLAHPCRVDKDRLLILAARGDRFVPPAHPYALWQHWGQPAIEWYSGSHTAPFHRRELISQVLAHLERPRRRPKRALAAVA